MSVILEVLVPQSFGIAPILRVRCRGCGRVYQTAQCKARVRRLKRCKFCGLPPQCRKRHPFQRHQRIGFT